MCGITGIVAFNEAGRAKISHLERSVACLEKRGPDGNGTFVHNDVGLGQARLSVIDVSTNASQPFHDNSGRYTIVFNGEFFNFQKYRQLLKAEGVVFRSHSEHRQKYWACTF
jgi:asparagine synthase (glutamine-hydrolysing)